MSSAVDKFLTSLVGAKDWNPQFARIKAWAVAGKIGEMLAAAEALTNERQTPNIEALVRYSVLDSLERTLALTPGQLYAEAAVRVMQEREPQNGTLYRRRTFTRSQGDTASLLAQAQPPEVLSRLFRRLNAKPQHLELLACLVQEMVLRGIPVTGPATECWTQIAGIHPLGGLPLMLLPCESRFSQFLPRYGPQTRSNSTPGPSAEAVKPLPPPVEIDIRWAEIEVSADEAAAMGAATANWEQESNGKSEMRLFRSDIVVPPPSLTDRQVLSLPLEALAGAGFKDLWLVPYSVADAVAVLFGAACTGGAYNQGLGGAYGRRAAWEAAGALAGAGRSASIKDAAALVSECAWWFCTAKSEWFYDVAWDIGLLALRPDGRTLAALAATDTD